MMDHGVTVDAPHWFPEDSGEFLGESSIKLITLKQGEGLRLPFGWAVTWCFVPDKCDYTKMERSMTGHILVKWTLAEDDAGASGACREVERSTARLLDAQGSSKPRSVVRTTLEQWCEKLPDLA